MWSARVSQKGSQVAWRQVATAQHPALVQMRHQSHSILQFTTSNRSTLLLKERLERYHRNGARLYARRWIELALASAATRKLQTQLQEALQKAPSQWTDWEKKDWTDALLSNLGRTSLERAWMAGASWKFIPPFLPTNISYYLLVPWCVV